MTPEARLIERLCALRPDIANIVGFHDLIDQGAARTPFDAMIYQIHLTASAVKMAREVHQIIQDVTDGNL